MDIRRRSTSIANLLASVPEEERIKQISAGASALRFAREKGYTETVKVLYQTARFDTGTEARRINCRKRLDTS